MSGTPILLTPSLPAPYLQALAIPVLLLSLPLLLVGAFLTLDRTHSFPSRHSRAKLDADLPAQSTPRWRFEGGVGGLLAGWLFGVHACMYFTLLATNRTAATPLSPPAFLALWIISSVPPAVLAARFRIAALIVIAVFGSVSLTLLLSTVFNPPLLALGILVPIFAVPLLIAALLPHGPTTTILPLLQHISIRVSLAALASLSLYLAIGLLANVQGWANIWLRLAVNDGELNWTGVDKGVSAAAWISFGLGIGSDWALHRVFGEDPAEIWDAYLASYNPTAPAPRAGTFTPFRSLLDRVLHRSAAVAPLPDDILFPPTSELLPTTFHPIPSRRHLTLKKPFPARVAARLPDNDNGVEDEEMGGLAWLRNRPAIGARVDTSGSDLSGTTLASDEGPDTPVEKTGQEKRLRFRVAEYSDDDDDEAPKEADISDLAQTTGMPLLRNLRTRTPPIGFRPISPLAEPMDIHEALSSQPTESLLKALDRVARAREKAGEQHLQPARGEEETDEWKEFWDDVRAAAGGRA